MTVSAKTTQLEVAHPTKGFLLVITGPSGVGKDTVIDWLVQNVEPPGSLIRVRRTITRPANSGGEDHLAVTLDEFEELEASGAFCSAWRAHDLCYGLPMALRDDIAKGGRFIVNGSRRALTSIKQVFPSSLLIVLTADRETVAKRLSARGRETTDQILKRLHFAGHDVPDEFDPHIVENTGAIDDAGQQILTLMKRYAES